MSEPNFADKTLWTGENLDILRGMNSQCVDLIYLDPPSIFQADYPKDAGEDFKNAWDLSDLDVARRGLTTDEMPGLADALRAAGSNHGRAMQSYLGILAVRLVQLHRVLKPTGSVYLHCYPATSHYLKTLMDGIFGARNFRNEVIWRRGGGRSDGDYFGRAHDVLLFYAGEGAAWNPQSMSGISGVAPRGYTGQDERGPWRSAPLLAQGRSGQESGEPWRGIDPGRVGRQGSHWRTPIRGAMNDFIVSNGLIPGWPDAFPSVQERLDALDAAGLVQWPVGGRLPNLKRYLAAAPRPDVEDIFTDIYNPGESERTGYPTQKPLALLERIIRTSSNEGDVVLDPFCGTGTALVAADKLGRRWVGIDVSPTAAVLVDRRLREEWSSGYRRDSLTVRQDAPRRTDM